MAQQSDQPESGGISLWTIIGGFIVIIVGIPVFHYGFDLGWAETFVVVGLAAIANMIWGWFRRRMDLRKAADDHSGGKGGGRKS